MSEIENVCINCRSEVLTTYCGNCGQKHPPKKINLLSLYTDFQSRIYGFDGMFLRTVKDLTVKPGDVALQYIKGNRVRYIGPVGYFFLMLTVMLILMELLNVDFNVLVKTNNPISNVSGQDQEEFQRYFNNLVVNNMRLFSFLLIPINAFFAWIFFRKERFNLLEHSVPVFYTSGHMLWLSILNIILFLLFSFNISVYQVLINLGFYAFACTHFYTKHSKTRAFLKGILVSLIAFITYIIVLSFSILMYIMQHPELRQLIKKPT